MTIARGIEESSMVPALLPKRWDAVSPFWCLVLLLLVMNTSCRSGCSGHVAYGYRSIRQDRVTLAADMSLLHFCMICNTTEAWDQIYLQIVLLRTGYTGYAETNHAKFVSSGILHFIWYIFWCCDSTFYSKWIWACWWCQPVSATSGRRAGEWPVHQAQA
jgi:hypothetical protein